MLGTHPLFFRGRHGPRLKSINRRPCRTTQPTKPPLISTRQDFHVSVFGGTKSLVLTTLSPVGNRNPVLGGVFMAVGGACLAAGVVMLSKFQRQPRSGRSCAPPASVPTHCSRRCCICVCLFFPDLKQPVLVYCAPTIHKQRHPRSLDMKQCYQANGVGENQKGKAAGGLLHRRGREAGAGPEVTHARR